MIGDKTVVLSIAAGRTLASLGLLLPPDTAIVRAMPNTAASVGRSVTVACANPAVTRDQALECNMLLEAVGEVVWIEDEGLMDAVTAVSGSGPAYVFLLAECLAEAGRAAGLDAEMSRRLARATVEGAGELLRRSDLSPQELREKVTSPKGTTAAALEVLMGKDGLQDLLAPGRGCRRQALQGAVVVVRCTHDLPAALGLGHVCPGCEADIPHAVSDVRS